MTSQVVLSAALVVALFSNAILLFVLILQLSNTDMFKNQRQIAHDVAHSSGNQFSDFTDHQVNPDYANLQNKLLGTENEQVAYTSSNVWQNEDRDKTYFGLRFFKRPPLDPVNYFRKGKEDLAEISDNSDYVNRSEEQLKAFMKYFRQQNDNVFVRWKDWLQLDKMQTNYEMNGQDLTDTKEVNYLDKNAVDDDDIRHYPRFVDLFRDESPSSNLQTPRYLKSFKRSRREADVPSNKTSTVGKASVHGVHEIFSTFSDSELAKFDPSVYDLLIPALVHFETMAIRELESLRSIVISMDLRLETLENSMLNFARGYGMEPQADPTDNKSEPDISSHILNKKEGFLPATNDSQIFEVHLDTEGSGDVDREQVPTTRPPQTTTMHNVAFYDMYRILSTLEQKVMALENYNVMSDSELTRVRSEVVKMDDKVTELDRRQRNLQIRTSMHTQKITELEVYMSKSELGIHTALDAYGRVNSKLDAFKDKLTELKNDLQAVTGQFGRHDQITNELRAADSYKAHDIQEMRKSVFSIEGRLNGLYRVLDLNLDTVRSDLRAMLDRLCANNKLAC
ncbi:unnamed protein product [Candidula unifasciata]|uniref:Uncharacterized protein n=1 Tax=Candidula unifasciata TaxID=100452 RepID=A0A8S3YXX9_9EUPU|nr:unnamed protein product [Candidula unifasciata]